MNGPTKTQRERVVALLAGLEDFATETGRRNLLRAAFGGIAG